MKTGSMDMGNGHMYQMFGHGGIPVGGIFLPPTGLPGRALWIPYVMVRDARRTADTAKDLGAAIVHGPMEVPGGDWIFTGVDRQGAFFATHSKKRAAAAATTKTGTTKGAKKTTKGATKTAKTTRTTKTTKSTKKAKKSTKKTGQRKKAKTAIRKKRS